MGGLTAYLTVHILVIIHYRINVLRYRSPCEGWGLKASIQGLMGRPVVRDIRESYQRHGKKNENLTGGQSAAKAVRERAAS